MLTFLSIIGLLGWTYLAVINGSFWKPLLPDASPDPETWPDIDIIVPARNEATACPPACHPCWRKIIPAPGASFWSMITAPTTPAPSRRDIAERKNLTQHLTVINAPDLPAGWTGKLAAMQAGVAQSHASYVLFTDADIWHPPDSLQKLASRAVEQKLDLTSRMVKLHCQSPMEKLLIPAFVFFLRCCTHSAAQICPTPKSRRRLAA